jgi:hypothetical protein
MYRSKIRRGTWMPLLAFCSMTKNKKADVAEHPGVRHHVGLRVNGSPVPAGLPFIQSSDKLAVVAPSYVTPSRVATTRSTRPSALTTVAWLSGIREVIEYGSFGGTRRYKPKCQRVSGPASSHNTCRNSKCQNAIKWQLLGAAEVQFFDVRSALM